MIEGPALRSALAEHLKLVNPLVWETLCAEGQGALPLAEPA